MAEAAEATTNLDRQAVVERKYYPALSNPWTQYSGVPSTMSEPAYSVAAKALTLPDQAPYSKGLISY